MNLYCPDPDSWSEPGDAEFSSKQAAHEATERLRHLVENPLDLLVETTLEGEVLYVSPNVQPVLGYTPAELRHTNLFSRVHPDDLPVARSQFALREGRAVTRHRHRDGTWRWLDTAGRVFVTAQGDERIVLIARDVTAQQTAIAERERLEAELMRAEKLTALGTLAGGIAHDFNNILTAILAYTNLALVETRQPEVRDSLGQILKATDRAKKLSQQILAFSRQQRQERQYTQLAPLIYEVLKLMRPTVPSGVELVVETAPSPSCLLADSTQIHQVLVNLLTNAFHAVRDRPGARVIVTLHPFVPDEKFKLTHASMRAGPNLCLTIADNGHGMDAATQRRIFEPFFTTKPASEGTGLGLAVVQRIVRDHDGAIDVTSTPGQGTTFRVYFPACAEAPATTPPTLALRGQGERILFVDDEPLVSAVASGILEAANYRVKTFTHPEEALEAFRARPQDFDLVITDLAMPGLTGADLATEVRKHHPEIPLLLASGMFGAWSSEDLRARGFREFVTKPFTVTTLLSAVHLALHGGREAGPAV